MNLDLDFIDYPTAWDILKKYNLRHDEQCSFAVTSGAIMCDCDALPLKWAVLKTAHDGKDGMSLAERYLSEAYR